MAEAMESYEDCIGKKIKDAPLPNNQTAKEVALMNHKVSQNESGCDVSLCDGSLSAGVVGPDCSANNSSALNLSLSRFEDSGVDLERSPESSSAKDSGVETEHSPSLRDCSMSELSEPVSDCVTDSRDTSKPAFENKAHVKSETESTNHRKVKAVDSDVKSGTVCESENDTQLSHRERTHNSLLKPEDCGGENDVDMKTKDSDDDSEASAFRKCPAKKRKYRFQRISSDSDDNEVQQNDEEEEKEEKASNGGETGLLETDSDLDSDDFTDDDDADDEIDDIVNSKSDDQKTESEEEEEEDGKIRPKHTWFALKDLSNRQTGFSNKTPPSIFREKVQGSLQMVQRLMLQYKMEYHEGCVNALSFNRIGKTIHISKVFFVFSIHLLSSIYYHIKTYSVHLFSKMHTFSYLYYLFPLLLI